MADHTPSWNDFPVRLDAGPFWLGGAGLGNSLTSMTDAEAHETIDAAWEVGVRGFDTAPHYGLGLSEKRLGAGLRGRPRSSYLVSTKVGRVLDPGPGDGLDDGFVVPNDFVRRYDPTPDGIRRGLDASLERLGLDHVDVLFLHDPDLSGIDGALRTALPTLLSLRDEGVVKAVGIGSGSVASHNEALDLGGVDVAMLSGRYTLLDQSAAELLDRFADEGVGVIAASVFNSGILSADTVPEATFYDYAPAPAAVLDRVRAIHDVCAAHGVGLPAAAFAFASRPEAVQAVALGAQSRAHVLENVTRASADIPSALWDDLVGRGLVARSA